MEKLKFGLNYIPSKNWFYSWQEFNIEENKADIEAIKNLGCDHIRLLLRWDLFQINENFVSPTMLKRLELLLDVCQQFEIKACVTVFNGWLSGLWYLPTFLFDLYSKGTDSWKNIFADQYCIEAEKFFLRALGESISSHPALLGIDLGNEMNVYDFYIKNFSMEEGDCWLREMMNYCQSLFPEKINIFGVDHLPFFKDKSFSRKLLCNVGTMTSMHTYSKFTGALNFGQMSEEATNLIAFNIELAKAYSDDLNRKVWISEFGTNKLWHDEKNIESFVRKSVQLAAECENCYGFTWWGSHTIDEKFKGFHPIEYILGLYDNDNRMTRLGEIFKTCIEDFSDCQPVKKNTAVIIDEEESFDAWKYGKKLADLLKDDVKAQFCLKEKAKDKDYLAKRGITELILLPL